MVNGDDQSSSAKCTRFAIKQLAEAYGRDQAIWSSPATVPHTWYWEILNHACNLIKPRQSDLSWCADTGPIIKCLSIYGAFVKCFNECGPLEKVPEFIQCNTTSQMKNYFHWIMDLQKHLKEWNEKFFTDDFTHKEVLCYAALQSQINSIAKDLQIELTLDPVKVDEKKSEMILLKEVTENKLIITRDSQRYVYMYMTVLICFLLSMHFYYKS